MICPRCQAENPSGMRFCGQCGAYLGTAACRSCGAANPPGQLYCGQCAALLDDAVRGRSVLPARSSPQTLPEAAGGFESVPAAEIRHGTVLFCDIVNSTGLTERVGDEVFHGLLTRFLDAANAEVTRYGGNVTQFLGDGFLAIFGAPVAHEDHAERALLAAIAVRRIVAGGGDQPVDLAVRIGINTGLMIFGPIFGDLRSAPTAVGDTATVGARLQAAAESGTILIGEATYKAARGHAEVQSVGRLSLKGKVEPVQAYRLIGVSTHQVSDSEATAAQRAFVGRRNELATLQNTVRRIEEGGGRAVGIVGEPGIGKSRLVAELRRGLAGQKVTWIEGRCVSYGAAIPYRLMLDLLRSNCRIAEGDSPANIAEKVSFGLREVGLDAGDHSPLLLNILGVQPATVTLTPEALKTKAFEIFRQLSIRGSLRRPIVLVVEDLQWIDAISQEFLSLLSENLPEIRLLMLATYRPGHTPPWIDKSYASQIPLCPLSPADSLRVVRPVLRRMGLASSLADVIVHKAEGNPFFLEQLAFHAGESAAVQAGASVPATIRDVVMARIDRLPEETKRVLQLAAVIGREFSFRLLSAVWQGRGSLDSQLRELMQFEFVYERVDAESRTYAFRHILTQEAAYAGLLDRQRRTFHAGVGAALEALFRHRVEEVAELLALHFGRSDDIDRAVDYGILAAEKTQRRWANSAALSYFETALGRLKSAPDTKANQLRRIDVVIKQGELKLALGRHAEHLAELEQIHGIVDRTSDPRRQVAWNYWTGFLQILTGGRADVAIGHCRQAAEIAAAAGFHELDGFIASCLAQSYVVAGELRAAIEAGERALAIFEADGNLWWASRALWHLSSAANCRGEWASSLSYCRRALEYGTLLDDMRLKAAGLWRTGNAYIQQGDTDRGMQYCEDALALSPIPFDSATARTVRGYGLIKAGRGQAGIAELREVLAWFQNSRLSHLRLLATLWLIEGHLALHDYGSARELAGPVLDQTQALGYLHFEGIAHRLIGESLAAEAPAAAKEHVERALRILDGMGARNDYAKALVTQARLSRIEGNDVFARQLLEKACKIFEAIGTKDETVRVKAAFGELDRRLLEHPPGGAMPLWSSSRKRIDDFQVNNG